MNRTKMPRRMVVAPVTTRRRIMNTRRRVAVTGIHGPTHHTDQGHMARCELDSHADTCILGSNEMFILDYHQALWYGKEVANRLLNPNQRRFYGHRVSNDITDKDRRFGIEADNMLYIHSI